MERSRRSYFLEGSRLETRPVLTFGGEWAAAAAIAMHA